MDWYTPDNLSSYNIGGSQVMCGIRAHLRVQIVFGCECQNPIPQHIRQHIHSHVFLMIYNTSILFLLLGNCNGLEPTMLMTQMRHGMFFPTYS